MLRMLAISVGTAICLVFAWSSPTWADDDKAKEPKNYKNAKEYQEYLARKNSPHPEDSHQEKDAPHWLEEWGTTIQIASAAILLGAAVLLVVLRVSRPGQAKDGNKPLLPPSAGGGPNPGQPR